jgi:hypothetical protein
MPSGFGQKLSAERIQHPILWAMSSQFSEQRNISTAEVTGKYHPAI